MIQQNVVHSYHGTPHSNKTEQTTDNMPRQGGVSKALCSMKDIRQNRLHTVWFHL